MRTVLFLLVLLTAQTFLTTAQNFAPVGAKWHYTQYEFLGSGIGYTQLESVKDTVILGRECRKIIGQSGCAHGSPYIFDRNDSVFFYHPQRQEFCLLYDFGANEGETWTVYHYNESDSTVLRVDSTSVSIINGTALRTVHTTMMNPGEHDYFFGGTMVERIGAEYLFPVIEICDAGPSGLRCYEDSTIFFQQGPYECEEVISSINELAYNHIVVRPNPFDSHLIVDFPAGEQSMKYVISSIDGQTLIKGEVDFSSGNLVLNLSHLHEGIYFLNIFHHNQSYRFKVIKS